MQIPDEVLFEQSLGLVERRHEPVMVPNLVDQFFALCRLGESVPDFWIKSERFLAKYVQITLESRCNYFSVISRGSSDENAVELLLSEHLLVVCICLDPRV